MNVNKKSVIFIIMVCVFIFLTSSCVSAADHTKVLVTKTASGGSENSQSSNPSVSANGRYVAFESYASNLGSGSSGRGIQDIYVYDYQTGTTEWITHTPTGGAANGNSFTPSISGNGRYVTFASTATNLGPGGSGNGIKDIYLYDRTLKVMKWITHSPSGGPASNPSSNPVISADGTTIAFQSTAKNLGSGGSEYYVSDIYLYDLTNSNPNYCPEWITHTVRGYTANGASMNPCINADGRYIAFESVATNLGPYDFIKYGSGDGIHDIFCYDRSSGIFTLIPSITHPPNVDMGCYNPSISADGNRIVFQVGIDGLYDDINVYDKPTDTVWILSETFSGNAQNGTSANPSISGSGGYVAFESTSYNMGIDPDQPYGSNMRGVIFYDNAFRRDIFVYDLNRIFDPDPFNSYFYLNWITHDTIYGPANGNNYTPSMNYNGQIFAFSSSADNLGPGGNGAYTDIFIDDQGLKVAVDPVSGRYKNPLTVNLTLENGSGTIYYTTDGTDPQTSLTRQVYGGPLTITTDTLLRYSATNGVWSLNYSQNYIMKKPPTVTANPVGGTYNSVQTMTLTTVDPDSTATTYYTTDGTNPMTSGTRIKYQNPIRIESTTQLRYAAVDPDGNWSPNYIQNYTLNLPPGVTIAQLSIAAGKVKVFYEAKKRLPSAIWIDKKYTMDQFLYLLVTATININKGNHNPIPSRAVNPAIKPAGTIKKGNIYKTRYISYAKSIQNHIITKGRTPNYVKTVIGYMQPKYMVYMYSKIIQYYGSKNRLPNYVSMTK